jgi:hypothetical protein
MGGNREAGLWISCAFAGDSLGIFGTQDIVVVIDQSGPRKIFMWILGEFRNCMFMLYFDTARSLS